MSKAKWAVLAALLLALASYIGGRFYGRENDRQRGFTEGYAAGYAAPHPADTITRIDTLRVYYPVPVEKVVVRTDTLAVVLHDTTEVYVPIEIERKTYAGEEYRAEVSGWHPSLDWIEVYPKTQIITNYIDRPVPVDRPVPYSWTLSATADALVQKGFYQARAGLRFDWQVEGPLRWKVGGGYQVSNLGRGPYLETGFDLILLHGK